MILTGLIHTIFPEESYTGQSGKTFRKTIVWLSEMNVANPNIWSIEFWNDDAQSLRGYSMGNKVNINIAVLGRKGSKTGQEYVFNTIRGVKIQKLK